MVMISAIRKIKLTTTNTTHCHHQCFSTKQVDPRSAPREIPKTSLLKLWEAYMLITTLVQITQKFSISPWIIAWLDSKTLLPTWTLSSSSISNCWNNQVSAGLKKWITKAISKISSPQPSRKKIKLFYLSTKVSSTNLSHSLNWSNTTVHLNEIQRFLLLSRILKSL